MPAHKTTVEILLELRVENGELRVMDRDMVKRAMELSSKGLRIAQIAKHLGVKGSVLKSEMSKFDGFDNAEKVDCIVIVPDGQPLVKTAHDMLCDIFKAMREKTDSPFTTMGELSAAASVCYRIYSEENADKDANDDNNPVARLFELKIEN